MMNLKKPENIVYISIIIVAFLVIAILLLRYKPSSGGDEAVMLATTEVVQRKEEKTIVTVNVDTIQDGLDNMGFLVTQEYYFTQVETYTKEKKIFNFINSTSEFTYSYDGKVTAGIDFDKIELSKDEKEKKITVEIPYSRVDSVDIDTGTFQIYSEKESLWNPMNLQDYNVSLDEFKDTARKKAYDNGILQRSDEQAKELIKNFISNFPGTSDYEIEFVQKGDPYES